ncbi:hypothetical protein H8N03_01120 [Ramlibacter sp. USB13]|uniref:Uncharacterized protein n=1 Tax=Ramlibacter cellulosilyticus TaxID=2764187 RepID=A0A923MLU9_9BURK|nr:hypothetical protein [Ramlibacter cellulosilyticus]MBC5781523.1 hypothetical protein [Ramlibacter cellulosilyticus]
MSGSNRRRGVLWLGVVLAVAVFALVFVLGRGIESRRDAAWQQAAERLQGTFRSGTSCAELERFGTPAPWAEWASDGELQCLRAIHGAAGGEPWALVQVRYSVRQRRGEEQPDAWYEVTVAALRRPGAAEGLSPVPAPEGHVAVRNAHSLFVWKKGSPGAGASLDASDLPQLLQAARRVPS